MGFIWNFRQRLLGLNGVQSPDDESGPAKKRAKVEAKIDMQDEEERKTETVSYAHLGVCSC